MVSVESGHCLSVKASLIVSVFCGLGSVVFSGHTSFGGRFTLYSVVRPFFPVKRSMNPAVSSLSSDSFRHDRCIAIRLANFACDTFLRMFVL